MKSLDSFPSEQPEMNEWCTDCKEYDREHHRCPRFNRVIRETAEEVRQNAQRVNRMSNDTIYRQEAIDAIELLDIPEDMCVSEMLSHIELAILTLTSAEQKIEELLPDGTLHLFTDVDLSKVGRVLVSQNRTHCGGLYYADGECKTGRWISRDGRDDCVECSECHAVLEGDEVYWRNNYFCYHCGSDMRTPTQAQLDEADDAMMKGEKNEL